MLQKTFHQQKFQPAYQIFENTTPPAKFSVYQNLPTPKVEQLNNHACVSIKSILDHALGIGIEINLFRSSYYKHMAIDNYSVFPLVSGEHLLFLESGRAF